MVDSIFTKIIRGEIPCHKIYEDEDTLAFLDIHPALPGHVLVIPKHQVEFAWDLDDDEYTSLMLSTKKIARQLREKTGKTHVHMRIIGTDVPHTHIHLIPFNDGENIYTPIDMAAEPDHAALAAIAKKLAF